MEIRLFGALQVFVPHDTSHEGVDGRAVTIGRRKSRALLCYVAAHPQPVPRRSLPALLWPDHDPAGARNNLRSTLYHLRQEIGDLLVAEAETVGLDSSCWVDVREFSAALARPDALSNMSPEAAAAALELYRGDFLADFDAGESPEFEEWVVVEREHYRRMAIRGFGALGRRYEGEGNYTAALDALGKSLALDLFQEDLQRACLRLHYLAGDRAGAIRRYEELVRLLDEEMGVPPMAETRALYDAIITDTLITDALPQALPQAQPASQPVPQAPPASPVVPPRPSVPVRGPHSEGDLPFIGRGAELTRLAELRQRHILALVEGEAGVGKTRLIEEFLASEQAAEPDAPVALVGRARELESRMPYQPIIEALRGLTALPEWPDLLRALDVPSLWLTETARLLPELVEAGSPRSPDESRLWEGVTQFLIALAKQRPLLFALDDLQWADGASLGLLGYLVRQASAAPIFFIAATRPTPPRSEASTLLQSLIREQRLARISLDRISQEDVLALARRLSPQFGYPLGSWLYQGSEGNPFVLAELVRYARERSILTADGVVPHGMGHGVVPHGTGREVVNLALLPDAPVVPETVYALLHARLDGISEEARRVVDAAVAVGREFDFEVVARAAALSDTAALDALDELRRARLVHSKDQTRFAFDHSLIMEVAYREVGEARHRLLHWRVAAALESIHQDRLDAVAGLLAQHYAEGGDREQAFKYALRAGKAATALAAWQSAAAFYHQAAADAPPDQLPAVLAALGDAHYQAGDVAKASETLGEALRLARKSADVTTLPTIVGTLGQTLILQARYAEVIDLVQSLYDRHTTPEMRFILESTWGTALALEGLDLDGAARHLHAAEECLKTAEIPASQAAMAQVEFELGNIDARRGRLREAVDRYRATLEIARSGDTEDALRWQALAHNNLAYHLHLLKDPEALVHAQEGLALAREKGLLSVMMYLLSTLGEIALDEGDLTLAMTYFSQGLAQAERLRYPERIAGLTANLGLVAMRRGETAVAIHRLTSALARAEVAHSQHLAARIRLWLAPLLPPDEARVHLDAARAIIEAGDYRLLAEELARVAAAVEANAAGAAE